MASGRTVL